MRGITLSEAGMELVFEATWMGREGPAPEPTTQLLEPISSAKT